MSTETIARRYAGALADAVMASGETEKIQDELAEWSELFQDNANLQTVFGNPAITHTNKEKVLDELIARVQPSKTTANFLRVLLRNGRLADLGSINNRFSTVLEERGGIVSAEIVSARELADQERSEFERNLERLTGKKVNMAYVVNKDIIGGVVTRIGSTVYDDSVKTKLDILREQLVNG